MGTYLNPGNSGFAEMLKSDYVDKTGLIRLMNSRLGTKQTAQIWQVLCRSDVMCVLKEVFPK